MFFARPPFAGSGRGDEPTNAAPAPAAATVSAPEPAPADSVAVVIATGGVPLVNEMDIYSKFSMGYPGTFADLRDFVSGLNGLLGMPIQSDAFEQMIYEHCGRESGFAASNAVFITSNYGVSTTPAQEWAFVVHGAVGPAEDPARCAPGLAKTRAGP